MHQGGQHCERETCDSSPYRWRSEPGAAAAAARCGLRALPTGAPGRVAISEDTRILRGMVLPFLKWLDAEGVHRFDHLDVSHVRLYRAQLAVRTGRWCRTLAPRRSWSRIGRFCVSCVGRGARATGRTTASSRSRRRGCLTRADGLSRRPDSAGSVALTSSSNLGVRARSESRSRPGGGSDSRSRCARGSCRRWCLRSLRPAGHDPPGWDERRTRLLAPGSEAQPCKRNR